MSRTSRIALVLCFSCSSTTKPTAGYLLVAGTGNSDGLFRTITSIQTLQSVRFIVSFMLAFLRGWQAWKWVCVALLGAWVCVHFFDWWLPYYQDSAANQARFSYYSSHTQVLPVIGHHYPPDGGHSILDFFL